MMKTYLVGGTVRDLLLQQILNIGKAKGDLDWVVVGTSESVLIDMGFRRVGQTFPVFLHPETRDEYALARTADNKFSPDVTLEEDLSRRDLTINAIAMAPSGKLYDPLNGKADIECQVLRHIGNAFDDDPLRIVRLARFAAELPSFTVAVETIQAIKQFDTSQLAETLTPERVFNELDKALCAPAPQRFLQVLRECEVLKDIFPELDALYGVPQTEKYHPEVDTGIHIELCLEQSARIAPRDSLIAFSVLLHDLGKGLTKPCYWPSHKGHEKAGLPLVKTLCARISPPNRYLDLAMVVCEFHLHMHKLTELKPKTIIKLFEAINAFRNPSQLKRFSLACEADSRGRTGLHDIAYPQTQLIQDYFKATQSVTSRELIKLGYDKGPSLGEALRQKRAQAIANYRKNIAPH